MCGIVGFVNFDDDISKNKDIIKSMNDKLSKRGPDEDGYYFEEHVNLGHKRLIVIDPLGGKQPMTVKKDDVTYSLVYNGQLYNTEDLRKELLDNGFTFEGHSDTEVLIKSFINWGYDVVNKLNGIYGFAIWNSKKQEIFLARDHFGVKPLYYTMYNDTFIFSSEIKAIFEYPGFEPTIDNEGLLELFGIGPAHTPGTSIFKGIHELKPANFAIFNYSGLYIRKYWQLESKDHNDSLGKTCEITRYLLEDSISRQLVSDVPLCTFLSGGLDSSIITLYANNYLKKHNLPTLNTYSIDYVDNDKYFVKNDFQPNSDNYYINLMTKKLGTTHHNIVLDTPELADALKDAMIARDFPRNG